jgi:hypothetical protein
MFNTLFSNEYTDMMSSRTLRARESRILPSHSRQQYNTWRSEARPVPYEHTQDIQVKYNPSTRHYTDRQTK